MTIITLHNGDEYFVSESLDYVLAIPRDRLEALLCLTNAADRQPLDMRTADVHSASGLHDAPTQGTCPNPPPARKRGILSSTRRGRQ
jgi:hypothetical protein